MSRKHASILLLVLTAVVLPSGDTGRGAPGDPGETTWELRGIGGGGAFFSPTMSPFDPDDIYIATDMSVVFRTDDFGVSWEALDFRRLQGGVDSHVRFTSDPDVLYSLTVVDSDYWIPVGSQDGGATWSPLTDPADHEAATLHADPTTTDRLLVTNWHELFFSDDGGKTFELVYTGADPGSGLMVGGTFWDGDDIVVGTNDGLVVSTDGGETFALSATGGIPADEAISSFAGAKEGGSIRFFAVTRDRGDFYKMTEHAPQSPGGRRESYQGVYRLDWGSGNWVETVSGIPGAARPFFVSMARNEIDVAWVAGSDYDTVFPIVYRTADGGGSWSSVFQTTDNANIATGYMGNGGDEDWWFPECAQGFAVSPTDPNRAILTDFGGVHVTDDGGATWRQAYVEPAYQNPAGSPTPKGRSYRGSGLEDTSSWWLTWASGSTLVASLTDVNGLRSSDSGLTWATGASLGLPHDNTYQVIEHPVSGRLLAATSSVHDLYQSTYLFDSSIDGGEGEIAFSDDDGASWSTLHDFGHPVIWLAIDPNDTETMYASVVHRAQGGIFVTENLGTGTASTWRRLAKPPRTEGHPLSIHVLDDGTLVASYSGRRSPADEFTESSGVFVSTNGGTSWQDRTHTGMRRWTKDLVIDPHDSSQSTWYAAVFSHWGTDSNDVGGVYRTFDRGQSWTRISDLYRVESVTVDPDIEDTMYVTTEFEGLWRTDDLTGSSPRFRQLSEYPFRHPTRVFFNPNDHDEIWVTSFGGGMRVGARASAGTPPAAPTGLQASPSGPTSVEIQWTDNSDNEVGFSVRRGRPGDPVVEIATVGPDVTEYEDTGLLGGRTYQYQVRAMGDILSSPPSNVADATTESSIDLGLKKGSLHDKAKPGKDKVKLKGTLALNETSVGGEMDPTTAAVHLEIGRPDAPFVLNCPAGDEGWKRNRKGKCTWKSPKGAKPKIKLLIDPGKGKFVVTVKKLNFPATPDTTVTVGLSVGADSGLHEEEWTEKRPGKLKFP